MISFNISLRSQYARNQLPEVGLPLANSPGALPPADTTVVHPRQWLWWDILLPLLVTRILFTIVGFYAVNSMTLSAAAPLSYTVPRHAWLTSWARWDAVWYLRIVRDGYFYTPGQQSSVAFFPLYPALMKLGGHVLGQNEVGWLLSGVLISNLLLLVAMVYLWKLVRLDFDEGTAARAVLYALIVPWTLFLSAVYPMSLILAIALAGFYYARKGNWGITAVIAALAPIARPDGVLLVGGLLFEYLRQRQFQWRQICWNVAPLLILPALTISGWLAYLHVRFGDALAFVHVQKYWPSYSVRTSLGDWDGLVGILAAGLGAALLIYGRKKIHSSYMVYALMQWLLIVSAPRLTSAPRFMLVLFPIYIVLALAGRNERFDRLWVPISMGAATVMYLRFSLCYFIG